jgi:hypothetical protein
VPGNVPARAFDIAVERRQVPHDQLRHCMLLTDCILQLVAVVLILVQNCKWFF